MTREGRRLSLSEIAIRIEDLRMLCELERRTLNRVRLSVRNAISLQSLRSAYPGASARIRDELLAGEQDDVAIIEYACANEDGEEVLSINIDEF